MKKVCSRCVSSLPNPHKELQIVDHLLSIIGCMDEGWEKQIKSLKEGYGTGIENVRFGLSRVVGGESNTKKAFRLDRKLSKSKPIRREAAGYVKRLTIQGVPERKAIEMVVKEYQLKKKLGVSKDSVSESQVKNEYDLTCRHCSNFDRENKSIQES